MTGRDRDHRPRDAAWTRASVDGVAAVDPGVEAPPRRRVPPRGRAAGRPPARTIRALIIGVRVKDTRRLTSTDTAAVTPNWYRKRPETLDMKDTGRKMTTRLKVVAMTARPMSAVAARAASKGVIRFSSTKRKMFSSTTMASSMTMPTMSTSASMVTLLSVKPSAHIVPKAEITEPGSPPPR